MKKCPKCGAQINDDDKYCIFCGENVENISNEEFNSGLTCNYCHNPINKDDKFCPHCGMEIKGSGDQYFNEGARDNFDERIEDRKYESIWSTIPKFFKNIINVKGRATRREYWFPVIVIPLVISSILSILTSAITKLPIIYKVPIPAELLVVYGEWADIIFEDGFLPIDVIDTIINTLLDIAFIPLLIRRLRDTGKNPWVILCYLIPIAGPIMIFYWTLMPTDRYKY